MITAIEHDCITRIVWGEARGEPENGQAAVAYCVLKRASTPAWWGNGIWQVCHTPFQFSCMNSGDPNFTKLVALDPGSDIYKRLAGVVDKVLTGLVADPCASIGGSTHYKVKGTKASWDNAANGKLSVEIGQHVFFNLGPKA